MQIIGAGFGRTGTLSIKLALETLGFGPCYHMRTVVAENHARLWQDIADGQPPVWPAILEGFQSAVDFPVSLYYRELMAEYPMAKVLLSVRDSARWYESVAESIFLVNALPRWMERLPRFGPFMRMTRKTIWDGFFQGRFEDRELAIRLFEAHNSEVGRTVPADKLLVFNVKDGWPPLCGFLDVAVPDQPFPHVNDRAEMQRNVKVMRWLSRLIPAVFGGVSALIIWRLARRAR